MFKFSNRDRRGGSSEWGSEFRREVTGHDRFCQHRNHWSTRGKRTQVPNSIKKTTAANLLGVPAPLPGERDLAFELIAYSGAPTKGTTPPASSSALSSPIKRTGPISRPFIRKDRSCYHQEDNHESLADEHPKCMEGSEDSCSTTFIQSGEHKINYWTSKYGMAGWDSQ